MLSSCIFLADRNTAAMALRLAWIAPWRLVGFVIFRM